MCKYSLKANTIALYSHLWQRIKPALGHLRINKIQAHHLNAFYLNLLEDGIRDDTLFRCDDFKAELKKRHITGIELSERTGLGIRTIYEINRSGCVKPETADKICAALGCKTSDLFQPSKAVQCLSTNTVNHYHKFLSTLFRSAVKQNLIVENPCQRADPPRPEDHEPVFLDEGQAVKMIEALEREPMQYRVMIFLLLDSGMRRSELLGLVWKDIDFEKSTVCIRRNSVYLPQKGIFIETPKRKNLFARSNYHPKVWICFVNTAHGSFRNAYSSAINGRTMIDYSLNGTECRCTPLPRPGGFPISPNVSGFPTVSPSTVCAIRMPRY